jgi:hypothetical protein
VRFAGQTAHDDIEFALLQSRWNRRNIPIHSAVFEFSKADPPLSWHLTRSDKEEIDIEWRSMAARVQQARAFLSGSDSIGCDCPRCKHHVPTTA